MEILNVAAILVLALVLVSIRQVNFTVPMELLKAFQGFAKKTGEE